MNGAAEADRKLLADGVRTFVEAGLLPHENLVERLDAVPEDLFRDLRHRAIASDFYAPNMREEHGGGGLNASNHAMTKIEFGRVRRSDGHISPPHHLRRALGILRATALSAHSESV